MLLTKDDGVDCGAGGGLNRRQAVAVILGGPEVELGLFFEVCKEHPTSSGNLKRFLYREIQIVRRFKFRGTEIVSGFLKM